MTYLTKQEIFDRVVAHARQQRAKSEDDLSNCLYRGPNGTKCFAGIFIPDEVYSKDIEGTVFQFITEKYAPEIDSIDIHFVAKLQYIHDRSPVEFWESEFESLASRHLLNYTPPQGNA